MLQDTFAERMRRIGAKSLSPNKIPSLAPKAQEALRVEIQEPPEEGQVEGVRKTGVGDIAKANLEEIYEIGKGLVMVIPNAIKGGVELSNDPEGLKGVFQNPKYLWEGMKEQGAFLAGALWDDAKTRYREPHLHIPSIALDALTVLSLGGSSSIRLGRLAGGASQAARAGRAATLADKLIDAGMAMQKIPGRALEAAEAGALKGARVLTRGLLGAESPVARKFYKNITREMVGFTRQEAQSVKDVLWENMKGMTPDELGLLDSLIRKGGSRAELASSPKVATVYEKLDAWLRTVREERLGKAGRALLTDDQLLSAKIKKLADARNIVDSSEARALYDALEVKPLYAPAVRQVKGAHELVDALSEETIKKVGKVGFFEKFRGGGKYVVDPKVYIGKAIDDFYNTEKQLRIIDQVLQSPYAVAAGKGAGLAEMIPTRGIFQKYFQDQARSQGVAFKKTPKRIELLELTETGHARRKALINQTNTVIKDPTLLKMIQQDFAVLGGEPGYWLRMYDRITSLFRKSGTVWNPTRYITGNAVTDALYSTLAGARWRDVRGLLSKERAPGYLGFNVGPVSSDIGGGRGPLARFEMFTHDIAQQFDDVSRAGVWQQDAVRRMKGVAFDFTASESIINEAIKATALAPRELAEIQTTLQMLGEHAARGMKEVNDLDRELSLRQARINRFDRAIESLESKIAGRGMAPAVKGEAIPAPGVVGERMPALGAVSEAQTKMGLVRKEAVKGQAIPTPAVIGEPILIPPSALGFEAQKLRVIKPTAEVMEGRISDLGGRVRALKEARKEQVLARDAAKSRRDDLVSEARQKLVNMGELEKRIPGLAPKVEIARKAADRASAFFGEYLGLTPFERDVLRRVIPFYAFVKATGLLAFRLPFLAPVKTFLWHRYAAALQTMMGDPELPEWTVGYAPVGARENGDTIWMKVENLTPMASFRTTEIGGQAIPSWLAFWQSNPYISLGLRLIGYRGEFYNPMLRYGENMVSIGNGDVYKYRLDGKFEKTLPQAPIISASAEMFAPVQLVQMLLSNYDIMQGPRYNPDGTIKYPIELWRRLANAIGVKTMVRSKESIMRSEGNRFKQIISYYKRKMKDASPDERTYIESVLRDYANSEQRPRIKY